jgi:hypothetical protein
MGMSGHAAFVRSDCSVFAHIHPAGSVSMAALQMAEASLPPAASRVNEPQLANPQLASQGDSPPAMEMSMNVSSPEVSFPYGFPRAGLYRIFVQIKRSGHVQTGVFDAHVE